jgi:hypothetical protein
MITSTILTTISVSIAATGLLITILVLVIKMIFKLGQWQQRQNAQDISVSKLDNKTNEIDKDIKIIKSDIVETKNNVKWISTFLKIDPIAQEQSPLSLTKKGEEIRKRIKADEIFERNRSELISRIDNEKTKNAYDIQMEAFRVVDEHLQKLLTDSELTKIKDEAFTINRPISNVLTIFQILLRDYLFKEKNISIGDIDKHTPKK